MLKADELKAKCKARGLRHGGPLHLLVKRLVDDDKEQFSEEPLAVYNYDNDPTSELEKVANKAELDREIRFNKLSFDPRIEYHLTEAKSNETERNNREAEIYNKFRGKEMKREARRLAGLKRREKSKVYQGAKGSAGGAEPVIPADKEGMVGSYDYTTSDSEHFGVGFYNVSVLDFKFYES